MKRVLLLEPYPLGRGVFELAEGGTLFLDEIGDMPFSMQVKLLRVLQERYFERVGSGKPIKCDVRIVAATHQNLEEKIQEKSFREDLYYRLNIFPIALPPLRERPDDLARLVASFLATAKQKGQGWLEISEPAMGCLLAYDWPGNVRELGNLLERLLVLYPNQLVGEQDLPSHYTRNGKAGIKSEYDNPQLDLLSQSAVDELFEPKDPLSTDGSIPEILDEPIDLKARLADIERDFIIAALEQTDWVTAHAANWLKLQRTTLVEKMRKLDIKR